MRLSVLSRRKWEGEGVGILADQLTLFRPDRLCPPHYFPPPPRISDLPKDWLSVVQGLGLKRQETNFWVELVLEVR